MIGLLLLTNAMAEIALHHTVPSEHISGYPLVVDIRLLNEGPEPETIQNLLEDRWAVQFTIEQNGKQYTASTTKPAKASTHQLTLPPRGLQELRFEVPNSAAWTSGTVTLTIQTPLDPEAYHQEITIHPNRVDHLDWQSASNSGFISQEELLWQNGTALFINPTAPRFVGAITQGSVFGTSVHLGDIKHLHWTNKQSIYIQPLVGDRFSERQRAVIPWPRGLPIGPTFTTIDGRFMLPIWVPSAGVNDIGTMHMLIVDRQGSTTFRKLYTGSKPVECIGALNQAGTPMLALRTLKQAWLLPITEVGNAQVDRLPPQILHLHTEDENTETVALSFGVSNETGLFLGMLSKDKNQLTANEQVQPLPLTLVERRYSIQGKQQSENSIAISTVTNERFSNSRRTTLTWIPSNTYPYITIVGEHTTQIWNGDSALLTIDTTENVVTRVDNGQPTVWSTTAGQLKRLAIKQ